MSLIFISNPSVHGTSVKKFAVFDLFNCCCRCIANGAEDFIIKPLQTEHLQRLINYARPQVTPTPKAGTKRKLPLDVMTEGNSSARRPQLAGVAVAWANHIGLWHTAAKFSTIIGHPNPILAPAIVFFIKLHFISVISIMCPPISLLTLSCIFFSSCWWYLSWLRFMIEWIYLLEIKTLCNVVFAESCRCCHFPCPFHCLIDWVFHIALAACFAIDCHFF